MKDIEAKLETMMSAIAALKRDIDDAKEDATCKKPAHHNMRGPKQQRVIEMITNILRLPVNINRTVSVMQVKWGIVNIYGHEWGDRRDINAATRGRVKTTIKAIWDDPTIAPDIHLSRALTPGNRRYKYAIRYTGNQGVFKPTWGTNG
jgi:hypothetical protein